MYYLTIWFTDPNASSFKYRTYWSSSLFRIPIIRVGRISYAHCLITPRHYFQSRTSSFTSPFFFISFSPFFPRLFRSSSTTAHFKFQSLHYHIFIVFPQHDHTTAYYLLCSQNCLLFFSSTMFHFHIADLPQLL